MHDWLEKKQQYLGFCKRKGKITDDIYKFLCFLSFIVGKDWQNCRSLLNHLYVTPVARGTDLKHESEPELIQESGRGWGWGGGMEDDRKALDCSSTCILSQ